MYCINVKETITLTCLVGRILFHDYFKYTLQRKINIVVLSNSVNFYYRVTHIQRTTRYIGIYIYFRVMSVCQSHVLYCINSIMYCINS